MPEFPIVDSHVHLYDVKRLSYGWLKGVPKINRTYGPADFHKARGAVEVEKYVFAEVAVDPGLHLEEARYVQELADADPKLAGMIGHLPLEKGPSAVEADIAALKKFRCLRGIRRLIETERGRIAVGWLIVEDLVMVLALVLLPALAGVLGAAAPVDAHAGAHGAPGGGSGRQARVVAQRAVVVDGRAGAHHHAMTVEQPLNDGPDLLRRLASAIDHFRNARAELAMGVDARKSQVLIGRPLQSGHRLLNRQNPRLHVAQDIPYVVHPLSPWRHSQKGRPHCWPGPSNNLWD